MATGTATATAITTTTDEQGKRSERAPAGGIPRGFLVGVQPPAGNACPRWAMRSLALIALVALLPGPAAAEPRLVFDSPTGVAEIPFQLYGNHIYVRGRMGDSDSLWIVLDTGASGASISESKARALGLQIAPGGTSRGAGGIVESGIVSGAIRLPGLELVDERLTTLPIDAIEVQTGRPMDVIVGHDLLSRAVVEIDYAARRLRILDPVKFKSPDGVASLPLTFKQNLPYVKASFTLPGRKPVEGTFVLDVGAGTALTLAPDVVEREKALDAVPRTLRSRGGGVGGVVENRIGRIDRLRLGSYSIETPIAVFRLPGPGAISAAGTAGNIGGEVLRRFTLTFDYRHARMWLAPNAALSEPFEADMTGLVTSALPDSTRALRILWLQDDSPATAAGIEPDDVIEAVGGKSTAELTPTVIREMFKKPGVTYVLTVRRGSERREVTITTRRLI